jgi:hypothetical protein
MLGMSYPLPMSKPGKGGRSAWIEREGDPRTVYTINLYASQREWLTKMRSQDDGGGAAWIRKLIDAAMARERKKTEAAKTRRGKGRKA